MKVKLLSLILSFGLLIIGCSEKSKYLGPFDYANGFYFIENQDTIFFKPDSSLSEIIFTKEMFSAVFDVDNLNFIQDLSPKQHFFQLESNLSLRSVSIPYPKGIGQIYFKETNDSTKSLLFLSAIGFENEEEYQVIPEQNFIYVNDVLDSMSSFYYTYNYSRGDIDSGILVKNDFPSDYVVVKGSDTVVYSNCKILYQFTRGSIWNLPLERFSTDLIVGKGVPVIPDLTSENNPHLLVKYPLEYDYVLMMHLYK